MTTKKYILQEKYLLQEKFILNEDDTVAPQESSETVSIDLATPANNAIEALSNYSNKLDTTIANYKKIAQYITIQDQAKEISNTIKTKGGLDEIKRMVTNYIKTFTDAVKVRDNTELNSSIQNINSKLDLVATSNEKDNDAIKSIIINAFDGFNSVLNTTVNNVVSKYISNQKLQEPSTNTATDYQEQADKLTENKAEATELISDIEKVILANTNEKNEGEANNLPEELQQTIATSLTTLADTLKKEDATTEEISATAGNTKEALDKASKIFAQKAAKQQNDAARYKVNKRLGQTEKYDWQKVFSNATPESAKEWWELYFKEVWGDNAEKVKEFTPFKSELLAYGFDELTNPFVAFMKTILKKKLNIDRIQYGIIHNSYLDHKLTAADLRGKGLAANNERSYNVIFCNDLYNMAAPEMQEYIDLQKETFNKREEKFKANSFTAAGANIFIKDSSEAKLETSNMDKFILYTFYEGGMALKGIAPASTEKLKPIRNIINELTICFGEANEGEERTQEITDNSLRSIKTILADISKQTGIDLIKILAAQYLTKTAARKILTKYKLTDTVSANLSELMNYTEKLQAYKIDKDNVVRIIELISNIIKLTDNNKEIS